MTTTRVLQNKADLEGETINGLHVDKMTNRNPLIWWTTCQKCGSQSNKQHDALQRGTAKCLASVCGKPAIETATDYRRKERAKSDAIVTRHDAANKAIADANAARLAKAERDLTHTHRQLQATLRERLTTQRDDELWLDPADLGRSVSQAEQREYNAAEATKFIETHPEYYPCSANVTAIGSYLDRHGVVLASAKTLAAAYARLREAGLIVDAPAPAPVRTAPAAPPVSAEPETDHQLQHMNERDALYDQQEPGYDGWDLRSGRPRKYTPQELNYLSADEYRRAFKIPTAALPSARPTR